MMPMPATKARGDRTGPLALALGVGAIAAVTVLQITRIPTPLFGGAVGPRTFPIIVAGGLSICAVGLLFQALRGRLGYDEIDWRARGRNILWFLAGLVANMVLIEAVGFVASSTAMFVCIARGFGSTRIVRDLTIGAAFSLAVYLAFRFLLGVHLGSGPLGGLW
jgi:putative tricarboxylic transport membrane protein